MITISGQVAQARGLLPEHRSLVYELVNAWDEHHKRNVLRHSYYLMHNTLVDLGISVPPELRNLSAACGWAKKCVDVMVEHSKLDGWTSNDEGVQARLDAIFQANRLRTLYRKATTSALEQCFNLYLVTNQNGRARVSAYPAHSSGVVWDDANGCLKAALFVVRPRRRNGKLTDEPDWVDAVTDEYLIRIKCDRAAGWYAEYVPHGLGHLPVFVAPYEATLERPFGTSRITREVMGYIDSAVRENVNEEIASAFAASAQKYLLGTEGDPFENQTKWQAFIGTIFNIDQNSDGTIPQYGQLAQPSMQPMTDHFRNLCAKMSAATGIHASQFGVLHDNPASADAIYAENEPLILKVEDWNDVAREVMADVAIACLATEEGVSFDEIATGGYQIAARMRAAALPSMAQRTDSTVKISSVVQNFPYTETFWEMNGYDAEQRRRVMSELKKLEVQGLITSLMGGETQRRSQEPTSTPTQEGSTL